MAETGLPAARLEFADSWEGCRQAIEHYYLAGWSDGLPVIPPTEHEVASMVEAAGRDPLEALGEVPPRRGLATVETVATCAVMAGCLREYLPVVLAAVEGLLQPAFNLNGLQSTGNGATPLCVLSGPVVTTLGVNYGTNLFGYGFRANAAIGRAIRLVLLLQGGAFPDTGTKSAMGSPARYSFCIGEAPSNPGHLLHNPWEPAHTRFGLDPSDSVATVIGANSPQNVWAGQGTYERDRFISALAEELAKIAMVTPRTQLTIVINPYAAQQLAVDPGWDRADFEREIFRRAYHVRQRLAEALPITGSLDQWFAGPESLITLVAGGAQFPTACALLSGWLMGNAWATPTRIHSR
ncbi:MAG: hypothetical protein JO337_04915 [Acidimicrobiales bacterium]|nr:hypothetical protein [Acidimicrobiales bacterium]